MTAPEKISIALQPEMTQAAQSVVDNSEYASSSQQGTGELRRLWQEALNDKTPGVPPVDVLERKYRANADEAT